MASTITVQLEDDVEITGKGVIKKCVVRAPRLGWLEAARELHPDDTIKMSKFLIGKSIGLAEDDMNEFSLRDFTKLEEALTALSPQKKEGGTKLSDS